MANTFTSTPFLLLLTECAVLLVYVLLHYFIKFGGQRMQYFSYMDMRILKSGFRAPTPSNQPHKFSREKLHLHTCVWEYSTWSLTCERTFWTAYLMFDQISWFVVFLLKVWFLVYPKSSSEIFVKYFNCLLGLTSTPGQTWVYIFACATPHKQPRLTLQPQAGAYALHKRT